MPDLLPSVTFQTYNPTDSYLYYWIFDLNTRLMTQWYKLGPGGVGCFTCAADKSGRGAIQYTCDRDYKHREVIGIVEDQLVTLEADLNDRPPSVTFRTYNPTEFSMRFLVTDLNNGHPSPDNWLNPKTTGHFRCLDNGSGFGAIKYSSNLDPNFREVTNIAEDDLVTLEAAIESPAVAIEAVTTGSFAQHVVSFTVKNQSAFARTIEFWDLANNSHATISFQPNGTHPLRLATVNGGDGRMRYRVLPNLQWFERGWIKDNDIVSIPG